MKWVGFLVVLALVAAGLWYFGILAEVAKPFEGWLRWIGAR